MSTLEGMDGAGVGVGLGLAWKFWLGAVPMPLHAYARLFEVIWKMQIAFPTSRQPEIPEEAVISTVTVPQVPEPPRHWACGNEFTVVIDPNWPQMAFENVPSEFMMRFEPFDGFVQV